MTEQDATDAVEADEADADHAGDGTGTDVANGTATGNGTDGDASEVADVDTEGEVDEGSRSDDGAGAGDSEPTGDGDGAADSRTTGDSETAGGATEVDEALVERVAESEPESIARELAALRTRVEGLEAQVDASEEEIDDLTAKLKRKQADFQNYKKRMEKRREQERERATEDLVERLLDVRDNLVRALDQEDADGEAIRDGVETTLSQFDRVLDDENVDIVDPEPGEEVDPHTHEVLMRVDSDQPEGTIDEVHRPGYVMAEKVLQTAQVTVSDGD